MNLLYKVFIWPFLNDEEPIPRDPTQWTKYQDKYGKYAKIYWLWRNKLHNFTWHVIGVYGKQWIRTGIDPKHSYALAGGLKWNVIEYKWWRLPYVSYINRVFRFRIGWGDKGNFTLLSIRSTRPDNITWGNNA